MSIRIGKKIGKKSFISIGKSGTYMSTWVGGFRISKFTPSKKTKVKPKETIGPLIERSRRRSSRSVDEQPYDNPYINNPYYVSESDKIELKCDTALRNNIVLTIICIGILLGLVYLTSLFYIPLGIALGINLVGTHFIWRKVECDDKWIYIDILCCRYHYLGIVVNCILVLNLIMIKIFRDSLREIDYV
jgi:hypothetical protein